MVNSIKSLESNNWCLFRWL